MRFSSHNHFQKLIFCGSLFASILAFPAANFGQQSLHLLQFDSGLGFAQNPAQRDGGKSSWSTAASLKGLGHEHLGRNVLHWDGAIELEEYSNQREANRSRFDLNIGMRRSLNNRIEMGIVSHVFNGTVWERSLRFKEEWRGFSATHWSGRWWMAMCNEGKTGKLYVEKHQWTYQSNIGFSREEFDVGAEMRIPILTKVRGKVQLNKIGQQRTHHLADIIIELNHKEIQFRNWFLSEGPVGNGPFFRSAVVAIEGDGWSGYRLWRETAGALRLEMCERRGMTVGIDLGWMHRVDAVRGTYDEDRALVGAWITGSHKNWVGKVRCTWHAVKNSGQTVYSDLGWANYSYNQTICEGRLERILSGDVGVFAAGGFDLWRSNASRIGWYQRSDWTTAWMRCGVLWQGSTAPRWDRRRALKRRMVFE